MPLAFTFPLVAELDTDQVAASVVASKVKVRRRPRTLSQARATSTQKVSCSFLLSRNDLTHRCTLTPAAREIMIVDRRLARPPNRLFHCHEPPPEIAVGSALRHATAAL